LKNSFVWLFFVTAALFEVCGAGIIRKGLRGSGILLIIVGFFVLGCYGLVVNQVKWDFSKLLGVYVGVFATISVLFGRFAFKESVPASTWIGLVVIILGGLIIQFGPKIIRRAPGSFSTSQPISWLNENKHDSRLPTMQKAADSCRRNFTRTKSFLPL
jgi:drug/metabolite transporter superfamily protein YnfA